MNLTFMFDGDRFGEDEDFFSTYLALGGCRLDRAEVIGSIRACHAGMGRLYESPEYVDNFPSLTEGLRRFTRVPQSEILLMENVFTVHERGTIPRAYIELLKRLSYSHTLAIVSNIWAPKARWLAHISESGVEQCFEAAIFSSDSRSIKPSPRLFEHALRALPIQGQVLAIGDNFERDILPAKKLGMSTAWITNQGPGPRAADYMISDLFALEILEF